MFGKKRNERWETIRKREKRQDIIAGIFLVPATYLLVVLGFCL